MRKRFCLKAALVFSLLTSSLAFPLAASGAENCYEISDVTSFCAPEAVTFNRDATGWLRGSYVGDLADVTIFFLPDENDTDRIEITYEKSGFFDRGPRIENGIAQVGPFAAKTQTVSQRYKTGAPIVLTTWADGKGVVVVTTATSLNKLNQVILNVNDAVLDGFVFGESPDA
jgi:hypothetical protein